MIRCTLILLLTGLIGPGCNRQKTTENSGAPAPQGTPPAATIPLKPKLYLAVNESAEVVDVVSRSTKRVVGSAGSEAKTPESFKTEMTYRQTILEAEPGKKPSKYKLAFSKAVEVVNGFSEPLGLDGKTILVTHAGDEIKFESEDGKPLDESAANFLRRKFRSPTKADEIEAVLPKEPIALGGSWSINLSSIAAGLALDAGDSKGTGTLEKIVEMNGRRYAQIRVDIRLRLNVANAPKTLTQTKSLLLVCLDDSFLDTSMTTMGTTEKEEPQGALLVTSRTDHDEQRTRKQLK